MALAGHGGHHRGPDLLSKGKTKVKGLYSEKKDTTYDAVIVMEDTGGKYINFKTEFTKGKGGR